MNGRIHVVYEGRMPTPAVAAIECSMTLTLFDTEPTIQYGVSGKRVSWPSGAVVWVKSPRMYSATLALMSAGSHCPLSIDREAFDAYQRDTMQPLRDELRTAADEALRDVIAAGDPA